MSEPAPSAPAPPPVPESLLAPLVLWAGEILREKKAQDVPPAVRPLLSFDRRGFGSSAARTQLRKVLETEGEFRTEVFEALAGRDEVVALLADWSPDRAVEVAGAAAARDDLALLVSALVVARPDGWELGVGVAAGMYERGIEERAEADDRRAFDAQVERAQEAQRRAEAHAAELEAEVARLGEELKDERASRREREEAVRSEVAATQARVGELEAQIAQAAERSERAEDRGRREAERAGEIDERARETQSDLAAARARVSELEGLLAAAEAALEAATRPAGEVSGGSVAPEPTAARAPEPVAPALTRRVPVALPPGVIGPSVEGLRAAFSGGDPAVIIDGYNVSMLAWGDAEPDAQRQRLCALLEGLHLRTNRSVTVVFDGADVEGVRPPRRPGVRVLFSAPGEEADDVVIGEAHATPLDRPVIVVSSDRRVQEGGEAAGALAVPSPVFLEFIRK